MKSFASSSRQHHNKSSKTFFGASNKVMDPSPFFQPKLTVGPSDDVYEREADAVADQVLRKSDPGISASGISPVSIRRMCTHCEEEEKAQRKEKEGDGITQDAPSIVNDALNSAGQPLDNGTRSFMESRIGYDFSNVKIHTGSTAARSAQSVNALAYTSGNSIVFDKGQYAPGTDSGKRLLAHELTHVVQQNGGSRSSGIQRACGPAAIGPTPPDCALISKNPQGERFLFNVNCDEFAAGEQDRLLAFSRVISPTANISILGLASSDGPRDFNESLSCKRAEAALNILTTLGGISPSRISATEATGPMGAAGDRNLRAVDIDLDEPPPPVPGTCPSIQAVTVDMLSFRGSTRNPFDDLAEANRIFRHCCVQFVPGQAASVDPGISDPLMGGDTTFERATCGTDSTEEQALIPAVTRRFGLRGRLRVFYFERINPSARATSHPQFCSSALALNHVYMTNGGAPRTLAHEFGHILLNGSFHELPPDNLMHPSNTATGSNLTPEQCESIRGNV